MVSECLTSNTKYYVKICLNPCFSGRWSRSTALMLFGMGLYGLNPCFSGRWSRSFQHGQSRPRRNDVLILVLVEDGLGVLQQVVFIL